MKSKLEQTAEKLMRQKRKRREWTVLVGVLALMVSGGVSLVLRHQGDALTYQSRVLDCPYNRAR